MYTNPFSSVEYGPCHQPSCSHPFLSSPTGISPWWVKHCTAYDPGCSDNDFKEWPKSQGSCLPFAVRCCLRQMQLLLLPPPKHLCCSCWRSRLSNGGPPVIAVDAVTFWLLQLLLKTTAKGKTKLFCIGTPGSFFLKKKSIGSPIQSAVQQSLLPKSNEITSKLQR